MWRRSRPCRSTRKCNTGSCSSQQDSPKPEVIMMTEKKTSVIICTCGKQLELDFDTLAGQVKDIDYTSDVIIHDLVCQPDGLRNIAEMVENGPVVIAACTSQKIKPRIDNFLTSANKDPSLIHYVNIREHSDWVHKDQQAASEKSFAMLRGMIKRATLSTPLLTDKKSIPNHVTVIGGGIAGIESALSLENLGYSVTLIEISDELGGHVSHLPIVAPTGKSGKEILSERLELVEKSKNITILYNTRVKFVEGELGDFTIHFQSEGLQDTIKTSAVVLAMGFKEYKPFEMDEYRYGKNPDVVTQYELSQMLSSGDLRRPSDDKPVKEVIMVQCVGSRSEDYKRDCSKLCCTFAIDNSLEIMKNNSDARVRIIYMDIRVPFENEMIYKESRENGVDYIRGRVSLVWEQDGRTHLRFYDSLLNKYFETTPDLVVLSSAVLPPDGLSELGETLGYHLEDDGHIKELYGKLRRNETRRRGVVGVGAVTRPQFVSESIIEAQAGALMIHNELQGGEIRKLSRGAVLSIDDCVGCSLCAQQCPRGVPIMIEQTEAEAVDESKKILFKAAIDTLNCHACGVCQSLCPSGATQLNFLNNEQLWSEIEGVLENAGPDPPLTLCFYCEECSVSTIDIVGTQKMEYSADTRMISVPCAGRVSIIDILKAFENGASTVMIAACETDRCHIGGTGNEIAQVQVDVAREILSAIGWNGERVDMFRMFSAEPERFTNAINEMVRRANEFGPTPVHKGTAGKWMEVSK
ncbi:MAG: hydrogenase iron-sulfur subunit [Candidatus Lokiarchaeota archaeon]|nr:hydrogenase iron-sulfur subunit [Candidatus Lokiarchaeota archaeon]